ncbi:MAG: glycosyltransferase family 4 protein [Ignavibacteriae bacterium]|nr:glycosyltransferase family 4 protein [Ignavibacteriota bacterium]
MKDRKKKILFIGSLPPPYHGSSVYFYNLVNHAGLKEEFDVLCLNTGEVRQDLDNVGRVDFINIKTAINNIFQLIDLCRKERPDLVYINTPQGIAYIREGSFVLIAKLFYKIPVIQHLHGSEFLNFFGRSNFLFKFFINLSQKRVDYSIVLGDNLRYIFRKWNKLENIFTIPNGIEPPADFARRELSGRLPVLFFFGNLYKFKGLLLSLEILEIVKKVYPEIKMNIAGNWGNDSYFNLTISKMKEFFFGAIKEKDLESNINFIGPAYGNDKVELLKNSDILVYPTYMDGFPIVLLDAMSAGCPVVTSKVVGAISEVVVNGETGYLISDYNPENYANAILKIIGDEKHFIKLSANSQKRFREKYSLENNIKNLELIFQKITGERQKKHNK